MSHQDENSVEALLADIRAIAQQQTELSLNIAEGLLTGAKSLVNTVEFDSLEEANAFLQANRTGMMEYASQLHELIASCYLDDLIGQKVMKVQKALGPVSVSSKVADVILGDADGKKIELDHLGLDLSTKRLKTPFRQAPVV